MRQSFSQSPRLLPVTKEIVSPVLYRPGAIYHVHTFFSVGETVGFTVGDEVGEIEGIKDGRRDGDIEGLEVGVKVGIEVGQL
jgi:hypothetical protein